MLKLLLCFVLLNLGIANATGKFESALLGAETYRRAFEMHTQNLANPKNQPFSDVLDLSNFVV